MAKSKDYTRVCGRCGTSWFLPKEIATAKSPRAGQVRSMDRAARMGVGRQRLKYSAQSSALHTQQDRVLQAAMCPSCSSSDYRQYDPGVTPPPSTRPAVTAPPPPPPVAAPPPPSPPAQWAADPHGRHELRYFDGARWTEHVTTGGVQAVDPV